jgi:aminoglycoside phosphotransferase (APT) family kinase protein
VDLQAVERPGGAFQQGVSADQIGAMCRRAFGAGARLGPAVELGLGMYNNTYRVEVDGTPVILRVAPEPARQFRTEREFMRNEYASLPYLAPIASLLPRTLAADFTHEVIGRDYLFQTLLAGVPAPDALAGYPRELWAGYFRQLGAITRAVHDVRGTHFGAPNGTPHRTWSAALIAAFTDAAADLADAGLDAADVRGVAAAAARDSALLDRIGEPRLLHGDLWTVNIMLAAGAPEPTVTGVLDGDRTWWGDPAADWTMYMVDRKPGREAFWEAYGEPERTPDSARRALYYLARHLYAIRLEQHRLGQRDGVAQTYPKMRNVLNQLEV